jgi:DNA-binding LacI/PurR family transcriptional regulator
MEKRLMQKDYRLHIFDYNGEENALKDRLTYILEGNVEGLVYFPRLPMTEEVANLLSEFQVMNIPVIIASEIIPGIEADSISIDYEQSVFDTCEMLTGYGHTKIALFTTQRRFAMEKRISGYVKALQKHSITVDENLICKIKYSRINSLETTKKLLADRPDVTAIVTAGFGNTLGVIQAIREAGLIIGKDISLVGSDCEDIAGIFVNRLTYVDVSVTDMTKNLVDLLMCRIDGNTEDFPKNVLLQTQIVEGKSVVDLQK